MLELAPGSFQEIQVLVRQKLAAKWNEFLIQMVKLAAILADYRKRAGTREKVSSNEIDCFTKFEIPSISLFWWLSDFVRHKIAFPMAETRIL